MNECVANNNTAKWHHTTTLINQSGKMWDKIGTT